MRIFKNCKEAASEIKREVAEMGKEVKLNTYQDKNIEENPDFFTRELIAYSYMICEPKDKDNLLKAFNKTEREIEWAREEFKERISQQKLNPGKAWKLRESIWKEFLYPGHEENAYTEEFAYTYSERIGDQLEKVINMLKENPHSRNGIISIWDREIDNNRIGGKMRVPCSMDYQLLIRNNKIHLIYHIRSNDVMAHWCFDVWMAISMMEYVSGKLGIEIGNFYQFIGSLHAYQKDLKGIF